MPFPNFCARSPSLRSFLAIPAFFLVCHAGVCLAAAIRGVVTELSGAKVTGAIVALLAATARWWLRLSPTADGSFQISPEQRAATFSWSQPRAFASWRRPVSTPAAGQHRAQRGARAGVGARVHRGYGHRHAHAAAADQRRHKRDRALDLDAADDLVSVLRLMPGTFVAQIGQMGAQTSLFVRGGDSDANKVMLDGVERATWAALRLWPPVDHCR